jgi:putative heme transporter
MLDLAPEQGLVRDLESAGPPGRARQGRPVRLATYAVGVAVGAVVLVALFPIVTGAPWRAIATTVSTVPAATLVGLVVLWAAGLVSHTVTLTAALPGLSHRRALLLSLTGSAVANVLPLGGAAGIAMNYRMTRRWGFSSAGFASYTVVTNLWDVLAKFLLPLVVLPVLVLGLPVRAGLAHLILAAVIALPLVGGMAALLITHPRIAGRLGARVERVRLMVASTVADGWRRLSAGMVVYTLLLFALLVSCLSVTGAGVGLGIVLLAFCAERLATLAGLTPGGLGLVEVGLAGALMLAPDANAAGVAAGVLLYRALTVGLEIPVGGVLLAGWVLRERVRP